MGMELLAPAGDMERLRMAVTYGADAVYLGGSRYGLRAKARNFDREQMREKSKTPVQPLIWISNRK